MTIYFKPLRRKIGAVTLLMACVFTMGWLRSTATYDTIRVRVSDLNHVFIESNMGRIMWLLTLESGPLQGRYTLHESDKSEDRSYRWLGDKENRWKAYGFEFSRLSHGKANMGGPLTWYPDGGTDWIILFVPYWSVTIPLTLLSAWLLLSNPRAKKIELITSKPSTDSLS